MSGRQTRGRQRIPIRRIESQDDLYATFSKRRLGLYKKASELCTLCGVDMGIIIFSPTDIPYSFFSPTMESVIERYRNPSQLTEPTRLGEARSRAVIHQCNARLDVILDEKEALRERERALDEIDRARERGWWEQPVETLGKEQVKEWISWWSAFQGKLGRRMHELTNAAGSSSNFAQGSGLITQNCFPGDALQAGHGGGMVAGDQFQFPTQFYGAPGVQYAPVPGRNLQFYGAPGTQEAGGGPSFTAQFNENQFEFPAGGSNFQYYLPAPGENEPGTGSSRTTDGGGYFPH